jgi:hypothetical protein
VFGIDDVVEGAAFGIGAVAVGAMAIFGGPKAKPYAKRAMKGYMTVAHRAQEAAAEAAERVQDLYHEARHEYESELSGPRADEKPAAPKRARAARSRTTRARSTSSTSRASRARSSSRAAGASAE